MEIGLENRKCMSVFLFYLANFDIIIVPAEGFVVLHSGKEFGFGNEVADPSHYVMVSEGPIFCRRFSYEYSRRPSQQRSDGKDTL